MYISDLYKEKSPLISLEVFPPKQTSSFDTIFDTLQKVSELSPDFISVTYGASGSKDSVDKCIQIASNIENVNHGLALSHLTCVSATKEKISSIAADLFQNNVKNILALRGDLPVGGKPVQSDYQHAYQLIADLKEMNQFCIGAACYPEGHIDELNSSENFIHMKKKEDAGADFFVSQLFFENRSFYRLLEGAEKNGITKPISAGIMPILSRSQIERMIFMCGTSLPSEIIKLLHRYEKSPEDLRKAGIEYAANQARELAQSGVDGIHIYTMNQPDIATAIVSAL